VPISTQCLHAAGSALAFKLRNETRVASPWWATAASRRPTSTARSTSPARCSLLLAVIVNNGGRSRCRATRRRARRRWRRKASPAD
jgi:pyruvate dehydrogenase E1 component alpha subunit